MPYTDDERLADQRGQLTNPLPVFEGAVLLCIVCSTTFDATGWGHNELTCTNCGTEQTVELRPEALPFGLY